MIKITIDNVDYNIPSEWSDVKLSQYEKWFECDIKEKEDEIAFVSNVSGIDLNLLKTLPLSFYNDLVDIIGFSLKDANMLPKSNIIIDGIQYSINSRNELTLDEWVDTEAVLKGNDNKLSSVLAIVCRPTGEIYNSNRLSERIELYKNITMDKLFPLFSFFLTLKEQYQKIMNTCLMVQEVTNQLHLHIENLVKNGGGISRLQNWRMIIFKKWITFSNSKLLKYLTSFLIRLISKKQKKNNKSLKNN
ncbi:MAG: hypothetical protein LBV71_16060 [Prevotella sp.]|jgi:hypothetical protein|nr:hypothetical protein [Prevotella sp.]